jgi:hypothetical protein
MELSKSVCSSYPPTIYNNGFEWDEQSVADLAQDAVLGELIEHGQIDYVFSVAEDLESVRKLLTFQIRRAILRRRVKRPVDRLIERIRELAKAGEIVSEKVGTEIVYRLEGTQTVRNPLNDQSCQECAFAAREIPRILSKVESSRESMIYSPANLRIFVEIVLTCGNVVSELEFRKILEILLTPWTPASFVPIDEKFGLEPIEPSGLIDERFVMESAVKFVENLTSEDRVILACKFQDLPDATVAQELGVSRPTVVSKKKALYERMRDDFFSAMPEQQHELAMAVIADRCTLALEVSL